MLTEQQISDCVYWACEQEVYAPKPGNVNLFSDGHNMVVQDFLNSARAIAPIMAKPDLTIGERIFEAVTATRKVVNCNTNLGIILLFAPLVQAVQECETFEQLPTSLARCLATLTQADAEQAYAAIRLAEAGGLATTAEQDIQNTPTVTLLEAMQLAVSRDTIAAQYVFNFRDVWQIGFQQLTIALNSGEKVEWAAAFAYLCLLSSVPDTLIARKQSWQHAQAVSEQAQLFILKMNTNKPLSSLQAELGDWDQQLKSLAINPGTTADLTAASLLLLAFSQAFDSNRISDARCT